LRLAIRTAISAAGMLVLLGCAEVPLIPTMEGPDTCSANAPATFSVQSSDPNGRNVAYCLGWGDGTRAKWTDYFPNNQPVEATHTYTGPGVFSVTVRAMDEAGHESDWAPPWFLSVLYRAPGRPSVLAGPDSGYHNTPYEFAAQSTDSAGRKVAIRFDWGDGDTSDWSDSVASGAEVSISHAFMDTGSYIVRAQARSAAGDTSAWSFPHTTSVAVGWDTMMFDGFEGEFPGTRWSLVGSPTWGPEDYRCYEGRKSAWCAGSSRNAPGYSKEMYSAMVYGPFSLAGVDSARVLFTDYVDTEPDFDFFCWLASTDGSNFGGYEVSGNYPYWERDTLDLEYVPGVGRLIGRSRVWIAFVFYSDYSIQFDGAYVDSVALMKFTGFAGTGLRTSGGAPTARPPRCVLGPHGRVRTVQMNLAEPKTNMPVLKRSKP